MTSHVPTDEGNGHSHTDGLEREGFPRILWEVLQGASYATPPQYAVQLFEEHRVPRYRVRMTLEPHPLQPGWRSLDSKSFGFRAEDTIESIALHVLTTFYGFHPLELSTHPIGLFLAKKEDDPMWKDRVEHAKDVWALYPGHTAHLTVQCMSALYRLQALRGEAMSQLMGLVESTKITLDNREDLVVDLSTELVEVNQHLDLHHQEIQDMEAEGAEEHVEIEGGEEPEPTSSLDTAGSGRPPSPESSVASFVH
jgi:hypothetical protein